MAHNSLYLACITGDLGTVKKVLNGREENFDINKVMSYGFFQNSTSLMVASSGDHLEIVKELLKNGADPNVITDRSPLDRACAAGRIEIIKELLNHGADPSLLNPIVQIIDAGSSRFTNDQRMRLVSELFKAGAQMKKEIRNTAILILNTAGRNNPTFHAAKEYLKYEKRVQKLTIFAKMNRDVACHLSKFMT